MRHHRLLALWRRRRRDAVFVMSLPIIEAREADLLSRPPLSVAGLGASDTGDKWVVDLDRLLWNDTRELDVLGLCAGEEGVVSCDGDFEVRFSDSDREGAGEETEEDRDGDEAEVEMLSGGGSVSGAPRLLRRGLGAVEGLALAARLWA